jgi:hypothetical protein
VGSKTGRPRTNSEADFLSHVVKQDGCWGWTGKVQEDGYAYYSLGSEYPAYRVSYVMHHGPVPLGLVVRHTCHNRLCVNPDHLILGTQTENVADMVESGRSKLCGPRGLRLGPPPPRQKSNWSPERVLALRQALGFSQEQLARDRDNYPSLGVRQDGPVETGVAVPRSTRSESRVILKLPPPSA